LVPGSIRDKRNLLDTSVPGREDAAILGRNFAVEHLSDRIMPNRFSIRHTAHSRKPSAPYEYEILDGLQVVARYWHDFRGDEHGIEFFDGRSEGRPVGRMVDFVSGGGPEPLGLSDAAVAFLIQKLGSTGGQQTTSL